MRLDFSDFNVELPRQPRTWLVTGAAGFIGSNIVEFLLKHGQTVVGVDNFATGTRANLEDIRRNVGPEAWTNFRFSEMDIRELSTGRLGLKDVDFILHQAALGSVPRSIDNPIATHEANATGTLHVLNFAREIGVKRVVIASSSSVYGDSIRFPQTEDELREPKSPYAVSKRCAELYAANFAKVYQLPVVILRYFNVFGPRQMNSGAYAPVIAKWIAAMLNGQETTIFGDGEVSRDFCFVRNVINANLLAALQPDVAVNGRAFNVTLGRTTSLNDLHAFLRSYISQRAGLNVAAPNYTVDRAGDILRSQADIQRITLELNYRPEVSVEEGLRATVDWALSRARRERSQEPGDLLA